MWAVCALTPAKQSIIAPAILRKALLAAKERRAPEKADREPALGMEGTAWSAVQPEADDRQLAAGKHIRQSAAPATGLPISSRAASSANRRALVHRLPAPNRCRRVQNPAA